MPVEKQCEYLDSLLNEILEYNHDDYRIHVTQQWEGQGASSFVQSTDIIGVNYETDYVGCNLVRRDPDMKLADLPEAFKKWAYEFYGEEDVADSENRAVELVGGGSTFTEALEDLFCRIILLYYGYECLYTMGAYEEYCENNDEGDDGDGGDERDDDNK